MVSRDDGYDYLIAHGGQAFWNEYLTKVNCYRRREVALSKDNAWFTVMHFGPEYRMKHRLMLFRWFVATLLNCLYLLIVPHVEASRVISLITGLADVKYLDPARQVFRVGLHNFRFFRYPHILSVLTLRELCAGFWYARKTYRKFLRSCRQECENRNTDFLVFHRLCNTGYFRFADYLLTYRVLKKLQPVEVGIASQLEVNASFLSTYRAAGLDILLVGYQHGLFEEPPSPHRYEPIGFDTYYMLYQESEAWFLRNMLGNTDCVIKYRDKATMISWQTLDRSGFDKVLAFAAQDSSPQDIEIIDAMLSYAEGANALVLLYSHPNYQNFPTQRWRNIVNFRAFPHERHKNIDLLVTRYSTMAMDYRSSLGKSILFVPGSDSMCILENDALNVCKDIKQLPHMLCKLLDT